MDPETHFTFAEFAMAEVPIEAYTLRPTGRFQWLQRMAWSFLHKTGALRQERQKERARSIRFPTARLLDYISAQYHHLLAARVFPKTLIIGSSTLAEIACGEFAQLYTMGRIDIPLEDWLAMRFSVKVVILPWMEGSIFITEEI